MRDIKFRYVFGKPDSDIKPLFQIFTIGQLEYKDFETIPGWGVIDKNEFTGLLDKNGVEIYEGDLLKWHDDVLEVRWVGVGWDLFSRLFKRFGLPNGSTCGTTNTFGYTRKSEVIGNIYQNPELLKDSSL